MAVKSKEFPGRGISFVFAFGKFRQISLAIGEICPVESFSSSFSSSSSKFFPKTEDEKENEEDGG